MKTTPVVNYDWEQKRYVGNIVAVHRNNVYAGYVLKGKDMAILGQRKKWIVSGNVSKKLRVGR